MQPHDGYIKIGRKDYSISIYMKVLGKNKDRWIECNNF